MLGAFMEKEIFCDVEGDLIIRLEKDRDSGRNTKIKEKVSTALKLTDNMSHLEFHRCDLCYYFTT